MYDTTHERTNIVRTGMKQRLVVSRAWRPAPKNRSPDQACEAPS